MSFFKSIKGTFKTVQEDFSEGLKTLTEPSGKPNVTEPTVKTKQKVNWDTGATILHKNEFIWKDLYQYTEVTAHKAQDVDVQIGELFVYCDKRSEVLMKLHNEAAGLPVLLQQLQDITDSLALVEDEVGKVEATLVHLENLCEEQEYRRNVSSHHKQLAVYQMKKEHELHTFKVQLARQHADKVENRNKMRQHLQQEKQQAYDEQFTQDVDYFKKHGKPGRLPDTPESVKKLDIADVEIDEDPSALDAFLESGDTPSSEDQQASPEESSDTTTTIPAVTQDITSPDKADAPTTDETETVASLSSPNATDIKSENVTNSETEHTETTTGNVDNNSEQSESIT